MLADELLALVMEKHLRRPPPVGHHGEATCGPMLGPLPSRFSLPRLSRSCGFGRRRIIVDPLLLVTVGQIDEFLREAGGHFARLLDALALLALAGIDDAIELHVEERSRPNIKVARTQLG
jgi:hypothetical protein